MNSQAKFSISIIALMALMLIGLIWSISRTTNLQVETAQLQGETRQLQSDIDFLTAEFAFFEPDPILVGEVDRDGAEWITGSNCFTADVKVARTESTESWGFNGKPAPPGFINRYDGTDQVNVFGGETGIPLLTQRVNDDGVVLNCLVFDGFKQGYPALLETHMARNPEQALTMVFQIEIIATDETNPDLLRQSRKIILRSEPLTIPAAG